MTGQSPEGTMKYLVTGGGGFVGKALIRRLVSEGHHIVSVSRGVYPELDTLGVTSVQADISVMDDRLRRAFSGVDGVFHTAAKVELWGPYAGFFATNVTGTLNVIEACRGFGVSRLVFTSSPSVIADGRDLEGVDESYPYPSHYEAFYPWTKAQAEQEVRKANDPTAFRTVSLRPHLIFGPGDTNLVPLILGKARQGRLVKIGDGENVVDLCHIDDCVEAHVCAMRDLEGEGRGAGKIYFISSGQPVKLWEWIDAVLVHHGLPKVKRRVPRKVAECIGSAFEWMARVLPGIIEPPFTKFLASEMATSHYFSIAAAERDLGYRPAKRDLFAFGG